MRVTTTEPLEILGSAMKSWAMDGRTGETLQISVMDGLDSRRLNAKADALKLSDIPERGTKVFIEFEYEKFGSQISFKVVGLRPFAGNGTVKVEAKATS